MFYNFCRLRKQVQCCINCKSFHQSMFQNFVLCQCTSITFNLQIKINVIIKKRALPLIFVHNSRTCFLHIFFKYHNPKTSRFVFYAFFLITIWLFQGSDSDLVNLVLDPLQNVPLIYHGML